MVIPKKYDYRLSSKKQPSEIPSDFEDDPDLFLSSGGVLVPSLIVSFMLFVAALVFAILRYGGAL